jgi:AhpC/TSA family
MRVESAHLVMWGLAAAFGMPLFLPLLANQSLGKEIKLPPLRVKVGEKAPDFALQGAGGKTVRLSDFSGRNVLIDFYRGYW